MSNEWIWVLFALTNFFLMTAAYKLFGKTGLIVWIATGTVLANIQVLKLVDLFGLTATLGNITFGSIFLATDTLSEKYGLKVAKRSVFIGFFTLLSALIVMQFAVWFHPAEGDEAHDALTFLFALNFSDFSFLRVAIASLTAYLISQLLDVHLFQKIRQRFPGRRTLVIRNMGSTAFSQLIDSLIFVPIAFLGVLEPSILIDIILTTYLIKLIVALLDTPFVYAMTRITPLDSN